MPLPPDDWLRLKDVFAGARALPADARPAYLARACAGNETLRQEVESLLASDERAKSFLESATPLFEDTKPTKTLEGRRIGPYQLASPIGAGGMGEVYLARDTALNRQVAIKVVLPAVAHDPDRLARFRREAQVLASLNHPHIAQIHGFEEADGVPALVMELVEGPTLAERIEGGRSLETPKRTAGESKDSALQVSEALAIAGQIAQALEAAHERGIIHRDLKPANIKVREDGTVKLLDFGLAKALDAASVPRVEAMSSASISADATHTGNLLGTAAYMSPEQARGKAADRRADIWAFGCVLYEMLTGQRAFGGDSPTDVLAAVATTDPDWAKLPADTPPTIRTLLRRCLEKNRSRRLDSATAARLEIEDALTGPAAQTVATVARTQPRGTGVTPPDRDSERRQKRQWTMRAGVAALTVLVGSGGVWQLWQQDYFWRNPLADAAVERLTDFAGEEADAAISPDGKFMIFLSDHDGPFDAWITQIGSGEFSNITKGRFQLMNNPSTRSVGFSGDGGQVWFMQQVTARPLRWTSWISPLLGGAPRPFVEGGLDPIWSPDGKNVIYHSNDLGDPMFIADRNGNDPRQIFVAPPGVHGHYLTWSPDGRFVYFVRGILPTEEMDIWRIPVASSNTAATPERITSHNARVAYPAWLNGRTLIYSATAEDGSGQWLYAVDVEHRIPHRVSSGFAEQYLSVAVSKTDLRRVVTTIAVPTASLLTVPISESVQAEAAVTRVSVPNTRALSEKRKRRRFSLTIR